MLGDMKRNADSLAMLVTQRNLDIHFAPFHVLAKDPHFALLVQRINHRTFHIILWQQTFHNHFTLKRCDT